MNQKKKRKTGIPGKIRIFCLSMILALAGLTGCGRQELEFYTQEELAETSETGTREEETVQSETTQPETVQSDNADDSAAAEVTAPESGAAAQEPAKIFVDVCGAVVSPGVYELEADSRVFQAIELAGGYLPEAAQSYLNRASVLADGQQIYVPTQVEVDEDPEKFGGGNAVSASGESAGALSDGTDEDVSERNADAVSGQAGAVGGKVNLNTADISELTTLTGIGESKAQAIIAYREANGGFQTIEDLMKVDGIKEGTYAKIRDQITVS